MADSLLRALKTAFANSPLSGTISGGMWTSEVPEDTELPYVAVMHEGTGFEHISTGGPPRHWIEHARVSFHVYGRGAEETEDLAIDLIDTFVGGPEILTFQNKRAMASVPDNYVVSSETLRYKDGSLIYRGSVQFEFVISKDS